MSEQADDPLAQAAARGMSVAYHAAIDPGRMAILSPAGRRSFGELTPRCFSRQISRLDVARSLRFVTSCGYI
jgi:hypothetical protein